MAEIADRFYVGLLVLRFQAGDQSAFEELVQIFQRRLGYFFQHMFRECHTIEDLLQEVWLEVYRQLPRLANPAAFTSWLYQIARHRAYRELRNRIPPAHTLEFNDVPPGDRKEMDLATEDADFVHASLGKLPPDQREVLLLRFM
jgi:RNA polymerase sigma-70 factor (ECF subfamily)